MMRTPNDPPPLNADVRVSLRDLMTLEEAGRRVRLAARRPASSVLAGRHASRLRGRGLDFQELRRYLPGDDLRQLDWRASMRFGKPYVRTYDMEKERPVLLLVDQRMGMFFGSIRVFKSVVAARLAALSAWASYHAGDRVGGMVFGDTDMQGVRPLRSRERIQALFAEIVRQNAALSADRPPVDAAARLNQALARLLGHAPHDCLICVISDFHGADDETLRRLRALAAHNDVVPMLVYDPLALTIPAGGRLLVTQGELQVELELGRTQVREPLARFFHGRLGDVARLLRRSRLPVFAIDTAGDTLAQLSVQLGAGGGRVP